MLEQRNHRPTHLIKLHLHQTLQWPLLEAKHLVGAPLTDLHFTQPGGAIQQSLTLGQCFLREVFLRYVKLGVVRVLPDMLGISHRVEDVLLVEQRADSAVCWLLLVRSVREERFGESFESMRVLVLPELARES